MLLHQFCIRNLVGCPFQGVLDTHIPGINFRFSVRKASVEVAHFGLNGFVTRVSCVNNVKDSLVLVDTYRTLQYRTAFELYRVAPQPTGLSRNKGLVKTCHGHRPCWMYDETNGFDVKNIYTSVS